MERMEWGASDFSGRARTARQIAYIQSSETGAEYRAY